MRRYRPVKMKKNPVLERISVQNVPSGPSVLFIPVNQTDVRWAASAYVYEEQNKDFNEICAGFFERRVKYVTGQDIDGEEALNLSDQEIFEMLRHFEGPHKQQTVYPYDLGDLTELSAAKLDVTNQDKVEQAALLGMLKNTLGARTEFAALTRSDGSYVDYGILGLRLLGLPLIHQNGERVNLSDVRRSVLDLNDRMTRIIREPSKAKTIETVVLVGYLENSLTAVYLVASGQSDEKNPSLAPLRPQLTLQKSSMRGMLLALLSNGLFNASTLRLADNACIYVGLPTPSTDTGTDVTGATQIVEYLSTYKWRFAFESEKPTRLNPGAPTTQPPLVIDGNENIPLSSFAPRPFKAAAPEQEYEVARRIAERVATEEIDPADRGMLLPSLLEAVLAGTLKPGEFYEQLDPYLVNYSSLEHAFQTLKSGKFDAATYQRVRDFVGSPDKIPYMASYTDAQRRLLRQLIRASFDQNPRIKAAFKSTKGRDIQVISLSRQLNEPRAQIYQVLLTEYRDDLTSEERPSLSAEEKKLPEYSFIKSLELTLLAPPRQTENGFQASLGWVERSLGKFTERSIPFTAHWVTARGRWEIVPNPYVSGTIAYADSKYFVRLSIDRIGAVGGFFRPLDSAKILSPSAQFVQDLLAQTTVADIVRGLMAQPRYAKRQGEITQVAPYAKRADGLRLLVSDQRDRYAEAASYLAVNADAATQFVALPNPPDDALQFWTLFGNFPELKNTTATEIIIPASDVVVQGKKQLFRLGRETLYSEVTPELRKKLAFCPYVMARTSSFNVMLYKGELVEDYVKWTLLPKEVLWQKLALASIYAGKAQQQLENLVEFSSDDMQLYESLEQALNQCPLHLLSAGPNQYMMSWESWRGSPEYLRKLAITRQQKRRQFTPSGLQSHLTQMMYSETAQQEASLALRIYQASSRYRIPFQKHFNAWFNRVQMSSDVPWSFLRILNEGVWRSHPNTGREDFMLLVPEYSQNRQKVEILNRKLSVTNLASMRRDEATKAYAELAVMDPDITKPVSQKKAPRILGRENVVMPFDVFDSIVFTIYTPIDPYTTVRTAPTNRRQYMQQLLNRRAREFEGQQSEAKSSWSPSSFSFNIAWLRPPQTGMMERIRRNHRLAGLTPAELIQLTPANTSRSARLSMDELRTRVPANVAPWDLWGTRPEFMDSILADGVFAPALSYGMYDQVEVSGEELRTIVLRYKEQFKYNPDFLPDFKLTSAEMDRINAGQQTLLVRSEKEAKRVGELYLCFDEPSSSAYVLRFRGLLNIDAVVAQEKSALEYESDVFHRESDAWRAAIEALGGSEATPDAFMRSAVAQEGSSPLAYWIYTHEIRAVFDIVPLDLANLDAIDYSEVAQQFKVVHGVPTLAFNPVLAIRRWLMERSNIIAREGASVEDIQGTLASLMEQRVSQFPQKEVGRRRDVSLQAPPTIVWAGIASKSKLKQLGLSWLEGTRQVGEKPVSTLAGQPDLALYVGQMDVACHAGTNNPDATALATTFSVIGQADGLRPVLMQPEDVMLAARLVVGCQADFEVPRGFAETKPPTGILRKLGKPKTKEEEEDLARAKFRERRYVRVSLKPRFFTFPFYVGNMTCSTRKTLFQYVRSLSPLISEDLWLPNIGAELQPSPLKASFDARNEKLEIGDEGMLSWPDKDDDTDDKIPLMIAPSLAYGEYFFTQTVEKGEKVTRQVRWEESVTQKILVSVRNNTRCTILGFTDKELRVSLTKDRKAFVGWIPREFFRPGRAPYGRSCVLSPEESKDQEFIKRLLGRLAGWRYKEDPDTLKQLFTSYTTRLDQLQDQFGGRIYAAEDRNLYEQLRDYVILSKFVEDQCYWNAIINAVRSAPNIPIKMATGGFLRSMVNWQKRYYPEVKPSWTVAVEVAAAFEALNPVALSDDAIQLIRQGSPVIYTEAEAEEAGIKIGEEHIVLVGGTLYRGYPSIQQDSIVVTFEPVESKVVRTGSPILDLLAEKGFTVADGTDKVEIYAKLKMLQQQLNLAYQHTEAGRQVEELSKRLKEQDPNMAHSSAEQFLQELARANPRKARRARPNTGAARNPLAADPIKKAAAEGAVADFASALGKKKVPDSVIDKARQALDSVPPDYQQATRRISSDKLYTYFPTLDKDEKGVPLKPTPDWKTEARVKAGTQNFDLIDRLYRGKRVGTDQIQDPLDETTWTQKAKTEVQKELVLSAEDTARILEAQRKKQESRRKATIPASAGLCKSFRTKRLMDYQPPAEIVRKTKKHVLIWLSPAKDNTHVRVLQYRKGDHVDCDLSGMYLDDDLTGLLSRALQSNLYWLTEKPERTRKVEIWIGRVGTTKLYCAYKPDVPPDYPKSKAIEIDLEKITQTLDEALTGRNSDLVWQPQDESGNPLSAAALKKISDADAKNWENATTNLSEKKKDGTDRKFRGFEGVPNPARTNPGVATKSKKYVRSNPIQSR